MNKLLPWLTGAGALGAGVNAGAVWGAIQTSQGSSVGLFINLALSVLAGLGLGGWTAWSNGGKPADPTYRRGLDLVEELAPHCRDCPESRQALQAIATNLSKRLIKP